MNSVKKYQIEKIEKDKDLNLMDEVIVEYPIEIYVNGEKFKRLTLTPIEIENLVIGHLYSENLINSISDIKNLKIEENRVFVDLKKEKSEKKPREIKNQTINRNKLFEFSKKFQNESEIFKRTGGAHSCALVKNYQIIKFEEDVSRSNAVDKLIGYILKNEIDLSDKFIFTSCRISEVILEKILNVGFNILISQSCPTSFAVDLAREKNINLIGFARGERFNIYNKNENLFIK
ncbi:MULTISPECIES: formate dehydrogenase accessory sulfurtransferase FdhD [Anaerococcus]|uniref:formate dehydrogenase accessory sulfurtransferase FdhD n=1 Tax=Anaerococcus TaxID=165779 RepID=UPI0024311289|nr:MULTISPECIES: formate dehydrogenase accessory sulfurtransferase FdhD [Anaerococcus]MDD7766320.1 formate dehydrogenase accessory sulfurtransferase FdhD [Anaerococcus vaginalis]MDY6126650.1 formate dehydrogenase accessory sulfurtransferase FdhD [Anaerococcus sp.]